ncbi:hypothetical protein ACLI4R_14510 [Natrialbaceae archaeon A-chndr2]
MTLRKNHVEVSESQAKTLAQPFRRLYSVKVLPPGTEKTPATVDDFIRGILELQTRLFGLKNGSPTIAFEIHRNKADQLWLQFVVPTKRLGRKVRTQLSNTVPGVGFDTGTTTLPVLPEDSIGGGLLTLGRDHGYPLRTKFDSPPINSVVAALHRHAMRDTKFVIQILFQPVAGRPVREWWWKRHTYKTISFLRKEKEQLWANRSATPREKRQADLIERKAGTRRFWVSIRFAVIGAGEYTPSRVKELAGAFNVYEGNESGQYLNMETVTGVREKPFLELYDGLRNREFGGYHRRFQASTEELAGLVSIPDRDQQNLEKAL